MAKHGPLLRRMTIDEMLTQTIYASTFSPFHSILSALPSKTLTQATLIDAASELCVNHAFPASATFQTNLDASDANQGVLFLS